MVAYCGVTDLITGTEVPLPSDELPQKFINDAADEIDSKLGLRYVTPIVVVDSPTNRVTILTLKRLNAWLASGRLLLSITSASEMVQLHAYGAEMIKQATAALDHLVSGDNPLPGASTINTDDQGRSGPILSNLDAQSNVESFYTMVQAPPRFPFPYPPIWPAGANPQFNPYTW